MKQLEVVEKRIGENAFYIRPFPAFTAANLSGELAAILAPVLGSLAPLVGNDAENVMEMDVEKALPSIGNAFSGISGDKFERMMKKLLIDSKNVSIEGEATDSETRLLTYDLANEVFCGDIDEMYILCFEVIKLNFGGFFKKLGVQSGSLKDMLLRKTPSATDTEPSTLTVSAN